jgi:lipoprotein-releasing system ATP-binding protein
MTAALSARGLRKSFGALEVLKGVDVDVAPGEVVCVWGPSGAGKSTLLHLFGLLTPPSGGGLSLFGEDASAWDDAAATRTRRAKIGFLFQFHHLLPDLSLLENVMMPLLIRSEDRSVAEPKARELLVRLGLKARLAHRPSEASGGEQQRAALARALAGAPGLLLADEPTGNLDRGAGREVETLLKEEAKSRGAAVVLVTHNEELAALADRRIVLRDGEIQNQ